MPRASPCTDVCSAVLLLFQVLHYLAARRTCTQRLQLAAIVLRGEVDIATKVINWHAFLSPFKGLGGRGRGRPGEDRGTAVSRSGNRKSSSDNFTKPHWKKGGPRKSSLRSTPTAVQHGTGKGQREQALPGRVSTFNRLVLPTGNIKPGRSVWPCYTAEGVVLFVRGAMDALASVYSTPLTGH